MTYKITVVDMLPPSRHQSSIEYQRCVKEFLESNVPVARVNFDKKSLNTQYYGLKTAVRITGAASKVQTFKRKDGIYLVNIKKVRE